VKVLRKKRKQIGKARRPREKEPLGILKAVRESSLEMRQDAMGAETTCLACSWFVTEARWRVSQGRWIEEAVTVTQVCAGGGSAGERQWTEKVSFWVHFQYEIT
jgi:hypothetical protein